MGIRAYLDTNLYIRYLLNPLSPMPPSTIVRNGLRKRFTILFGDPTVDEIVRKATTKPDLAKRIPEADVSLLLEVLGVEGEHIRPAPSVIPAMSRDRNDDYLLTYSIAGNATHLVTGDNDLLGLEPSFGFQIITPSAFVRLLDSGTI